VNDFFTILGVPKTFREKDAAQLERRFHDLQRRFHPDHASTKGDAAVTEALDQSSKINQAYRTLRDSNSRMKYLLSLYGYSVEQSKQVPMDLLELVMNVQEQVSMLEMNPNDPPPDLSGTKKDISSRLEALDEEINRFQDEWDTSAEHSEAGASLTAGEEKILTALTKALAARAYLQTLWGTVEAATEGRSLVLKH
jgi:molecular chaperone HscB